MKRWALDGVLALYCMCIVAANWAVERYGIIGVGFGLDAPAGVFFVAPVLVLRDLVQWARGRLMALVLVAMPPRPMSLVMPRQR